MQNTIIPNQDIFETLNSARQNKRDYIAMSLWPDIPGTKITATTHEFWSLTTVLGTIKNLDIKTYQSSSTIGNILRKYAPTDMLPAQKFELLHNNMHVIEITDKSMNAEISRYAAWAIMKEIGKKYNTTFQQEYFLTPNPNPGQIFAHTRQIARIATRDTVSKYQKQLNGILGHLTKQQQYFADFHKQLSGWLFPNTTIKNIQRHYHISENKPLADYMNDELITAFANALKNIVEKFDNLPQTKKTYDNLYQIAQQEMTTARQPFIKENDAPELNICTTSVDGVIADRKKREQTFVNKYIYEKVR